MSRDRSPLGARRALRVEGYDYRLEGLYFVTVCCANRRALLGRVQEGRVDLSPSGQAVRDAWLRTAEIRPGIEVDTHVVMPNHVHGLLLVVDPRSCRGTLSDIVRGFKGSSTRAVRELLRAPTLTLWQRSYHDRVVRNEREAAALREYISTNPQRWHLDRYNPQAE